MEKGRFVIQITEDYAIDLATIELDAWLAIKRNVTHMMRTKQIEDPGKAYIAAFLVYMQDVEMLMTEFDETKDKMN